MEAALPYDDLPAGFCDQAADLTAAGRAVTVPAGNVCLGGGFSFDARVRRDTDSGVDTIVSSLDPAAAGAAPRWRLAFEDGDLVAAFTLEDGTVLERRYAIPEEDDPVGRWYDVALRYDPDPPFGVPQFQVYWDGRRKIGVSVPGSSLLGGELPITVGGVPGSGADDFDGLVDDVRLWPDAGCPPIRNIDLAFVIDTTGSMWDDIGRVRAASEDLVARIFRLAESPRVAVTDYRDIPILPYGYPGIDYPFHVDSDFSSDQATIVAGIRSLDIGYGVDIPESVYSGLLGAIEAQTDSQGNALSGWRADALKVIVIMGDAPPHDPEPQTGYTLSRVVQAALAGGTLVVPGDPSPPLGSATAPSRGTASGGLLPRSAAQEAPEPVRICAVHIGTDSAAGYYFQQLADATGCQVFSAPTANDVVDAILEILGELAEEPANSPPNVDGAVPSVGLLWPPNHKWHEVEIANVSDPDGDPVTLTVTDVTQDEPVLATGSGRTAPDAEGLGEASVRLRAERAGSEGGRVYEITFTASDGRGGESTGTVKVCVPHDQGANVACVDDGQIYDSTDQR